MTTQMIPARDRAAYYKTTMQPLLDNGSARLQRHWKYLKEVCPSYLEQTLLATVIVGTASGGGAVIGGMVGAGIGSRVTHSHDPQNKGNQKAFLFGILSGFVIGTTVGFYNYLTETERQTYFLVWHEKNKEDLINFSTFIQYSNDPFLNQCICQISQNILVGPCRTPTGYLVDYDMVMRLEKDADGKIICPFTREKFSDIMIKKDYERALMINKKALHLVEEDLPFANDCPPIMKLLENQKKFIKEAVHDCYNNCLLDIEKKRMTKVITFQESQEERANFVQWFGECPDHNVDWSLDWKGILDKRWVEQNPGTKIF